MSAKLVILGLLHEKPLYGYEIKQIIEEHMGDWTSIAFGSIYFALDKLSEEKFIEITTTEQAGNRPSRSVYQITPSGEEEFLRLLRAGWQNMEQQYYDLDICIFFLNRLSLSEVKEYLRARIARLEQTLAHLQMHEAEQMRNPHVPPQARVIFNHSRVHIQSEFEWTKDFLASIDKNNAQ
jgi:DNA-binding PadR family transcriptional regulator